MTTQIEFAIRDWLKKKGVHAKAQGKRAEPANAHKSLFPVLGRALEMCECLVFSLEGRLEATAR